jgi:hypothetical protein
MVPALVSFNGKCLRMVAANGMGSAREHDTQAKLLVVGQVTLDARSICIHNVDVTMASVL